MKRGVYARLAGLGIRKNKKLYLPYMLTCSGMVMMCYIMRYLMESPLFADRETTTLFLNLGFYVLCVFSLIFLFYTNSFLVRRRKKEFGLYNILGMGKNNIARVLLWESLAIAGITICSGLCFGVLFSKLAELGLVRILSQSATFTFSLSPDSLTLTAVIFLVIHALIYCNGLRQLRASDPIVLLKSENAGEKPPKANWPAALLGLVLLVCAYYMAITIEDPVVAVFWFFVAVILVIVATYLLFISGSVALCRALQKNKRYYYKTRHFVSVSSMAYRMRRNGAGLASICILGTMVLVMISSTSCLYIGAEDNINSQFPRDVHMSLVSESPALFDSPAQEKLQERTAEILAQWDQQPQNVLTCRMAGFLGTLSGESVAFDGNAYSTLEGAYQVFILPLEDYNRLMGQTETLNPDEILLYLSDGHRYEGAALSLNGMGPLTVKKQVEAFETDSMSSNQILPSLFVFVPDFNSFVQEFTDISANNGFAYTLYSVYAFDLAANNEVQTAAIEQLLEQLSSDGSINTGDVQALLMESAAQYRRSFYDLYGGLFFLGILLGIVFLCAAVLIIYYKQISEGYEDQSRFSIMQKVGMTTADIKKSINSQILTVFFLPLLAAGLHLAFAFPMIRRLLLLMGLANTWLLVVVTVCCYLVFAAFYALVYKATSRSYFSIVSGLKGEIR